MDLFDKWTREVFFGDGVLTHCDTATAEGGLAQGIYIHSIEPRNNYLTTKWCFCDTNRVDWKWVTSVEYNLERFWIRLRRDKDGKWCKCIWLLPCPFRTQRVISIPCLPPTPAAKECEYDYTLISRPHMQNRVARVGAWSWLAGGDITVERCVLVLLICLFVTEWPQGCPSSANSGCHRDFLSWAGHYGNLDKQAECRESCGLQKILLLSFRAFNVKANTMDLISLAEALSAVALKDTNWKMSLPISPPLSSIHNHEWADECNQVKPTLTPPTAPMHVHDKWKIPHNNTKKRRQAPTSTRLLRW